MGLLNLPLELLSIIIDDVVVDARLQNSLRLRGVNKIFAREVVESIFRTGTINQHKPSKDLDSPADDLLMTGYIHWKVRNDPVDTYKFSDTIRRVVDRLQQRGHDRDPTLGVICEAMYARWGCRGIQEALKWGKQPSDSSRVMTDVDSVDMLVVAALIGDEGLVKQANRELLTKKSLLFGSALTSACWKPHVSICQYLLQQHSLPEYLLDPIACTPDNKIHIRNSGKTGIRYPLEAAARAGSLELVKTLRSWTRDEFLEFDILNILPIASATGQIDVVDFLLERLSQLYRKSVKELLTKRFDPKLNPKMIPLGHLMLLKAVTWGRRSLIKFLVSKGAKDALLSTDRSRCSDLIRIAAGRGCESMVKVLLELGLPPDPPNSTGYQRDTALNLAILRGFPSTAKLLVEYKADANNGYPKPIALAASRGNIELVRLLLENGAKLDPTTSCAILFVLHMYSPEGYYPEVLELLIKHGKGRLAGQSPPDQDLSDSDDSVIRAVREPLGFYNRARDQGYDLSEVEIPVPRSFMDWLMRRKALKTRYSAIQCDYLELVHMLSQSMQQPWR